MKTTFLGLLGVMIAAAISGCAYGAVGAAGQDKVIVARNWVFGADTVYVCKVTDSGVADCQSVESP